MKKHVNIPLFIVHMGCPNQCVFCDQRLISGESSFSEQNVRQAIDAALPSIRRAGTQAEIAFFGGSFTGIDRALMQRLLDTAASYVARGDAVGIRLSTRPDYIDGEIVRILSSYPVTAVELGIQSFSDDVLGLCRRGHSAADSVRAAEMLRKAGIPFVGQMMVGLPGSSAQDEIACAERICALGAAGFRVYPTIVFRGTELEQMTVRGEYIPLTVEEAVCRMKRVLAVFDREKIPCLRAGLCESGNLHDPSSYFAGPNHPAIGELARSALMCDRMEAAISVLDTAVEGQRLCFFVPPGKASVAAGQHRSNIRFLLDKYGIKSIKIIENPALIGYNIEIDILKFRTDPSGGECHCG